MRKLTLLLSLVIILVAGSVSANEWEMPGADPTLVSWTLAIPQLKNCPIKADRMVSTVQTNHGSPIWVSRGEYFSEMTGGSRLYSHEFAAFEDSIAAYSWRFITTNSAGWIELVIFPRCGNAAWRFVPLCPEVSTDATEVVIAIDSDDSDSGFPWRILGVLGLLGLFGLARRYPKRGPQGPAGKDGRNGVDGKVLYVQPDGSTTENPDDIVVSPDRLARLRVLKSEVADMDEQRKLLVDEIDTLTKEIREEIEPPAETSDTEE